jgi:hypothetical protein
MSNILFFAMAWELEPKDVIYWENDTYVVKEVTCEDNAYRVNVTQEDWEDEELDILLSDNISIAVVKAKEGY